MKRIIIIAYILTFVATGYAAKREDAINRADQYCQLMNQCCIAKGNAIDLEAQIQDLFDNSTAQHIDDIYKKRERVQLDMYLDELIKDIDNIDINCESKKSDIAMKQCNGLMFYLIPIQKTITNKKTKEISNTSEIIYVNAETSKIYNVYSDDSKWCLTKVSDSKDNSISLKLGNDLYDKGQYGLAKQTFERVLAIDTNNYTANTMIKKIETKKFDVYEVIRDAKQKAHSGKIKKMEEAFKTIFAYQNHPAVQNDGCLYFFMANMIEYYNSNLSLNLTDDQKGNCVSIFVRKACNANCPDIQNFVESLPAPYRRQHNIRCR